MPQEAGNTAVAEVTVWVKWISWPQSGAYEDVSYTLQTQSRPLTVAWPQRKGNKETWEKGLPCCKPQGGKGPVVLPYSPSTECKNQAVGSISVLDLKMFRSRRGFWKCKGMPCIAVLKRSIPSPFLVVHYRESSPQPALRPHIWWLIVFLFNITGHPPETLTWLVVVNICTCRDHLKKENI